MALHDDYVEKLQEDENWENLGAAFWWFLFSLFCLVVIVLSLYGWIKSEEGRFLSLALVFLPLCAICFRMAHISFKKYEWGVECLDRRRRRCCDCGGVITEVNSEYLGDKRRCVDCWWRLSIPAFEGQKKKDG